MAGKKLDKKTIDKYKTKLSKIKEDILHDIKNMTSAPGNLPSPKKNKARSQS